MGFFRHAWPLLRDRGIPATVFVVAEAPNRQLPFWWDQRGSAADGFPERGEGCLTRPPGKARLGVDAELDRGGAQLPECRRPADWATITAAVRAGLELGGHSVTPRMLTQLDDGELHPGSSASQGGGGRATGRPPRPVASPSGRWCPPVR